MNEKKPVILRKRLIPRETVNLRDDELLFRSDELLITKWRTIRPKREFAGGVSYYFPVRNYKVSRFYAHDGAFLYWYCDIINVDYDAAADTYLVTDLLLDIKLYPDGRLLILDEDELEEAYARCLITEEQRTLAQRTVAGLVGDIKAGVFPPDICKDARYWGYTE